jgi:hypothetical protein
MEEWFTKKFFHWLKAKRHEDDLVKIKHSSWKYKSSRCSVILENRQTILKDILKRLFYMRRQMQHEIFIVEQNKNKQRNKKKTTEKNRKKRKTFGCQHKMHSV